MKKSRFTCLLFSAAMIIFLSSCVGDGTKEQTTDTTTTEAAPAEITPEVNTIVTTPQDMMVVTHKVADYAKFKATYDGHDSLRLANGIHSYVIGRGEVDTNTVLVAVKVDDLAKAKAFAKDPGLKKAMQKSGVVGAPTISFVTATFQDTAMISTNLRSRTSFTVKDWDAWLKVYEEGKQERIDNGLAVRLVGHDPDDAKKVTLVTAILDTAKASAYWKSDALKKRREAGGVTSEPVRFIFRVVHRY